MPSQYTDSSRFTKQGIGENDNTWGIIANTQYDLIDDAINGVLTLNVTTGLNLTLTANNGATDESRNKVIKLIGTPTANISIIVPAVHKEYLVDAQFTGNFTVTVSPTGGGAGVAFTAGQTAVIYCDGVNFSKIYQSAPMWNAGDLKATTGTIAQAIANNPTWAVCDGTNGTPDLRDRFIVGARQDQSGSAMSNITGNLLQSGGATTTENGGGFSGNTGSTALTVAQLPEHDHGYVRGTFQAGDPASDPGAMARGDPNPINRTTKTGGNQGHDHTITIHAHNHVTVPPFYAVVWLMKL